MRLNLILFCGFLIGVMGCAPLPPILSISYHTTPDPPPIERVALIVIDHGAASHYQEAFKREFETNKAFLDHITHHVGEGLYGVESVEVVKISPDHVDQIKASAKGMIFEKEEMATIFETLDEKFSHVLVVAEWEVSKEYYRATYQHYSTNNPTSPGAFAPAGTSTAKHSYLQVSILGALLTKDGQVLEIGRGIYGEPKGSSKGKAIRSASTFAARKLSQLMMQKMPRSKYKQGSMPFVSPL